MTMISFLIPLLLFGTFFGFILFILIRNKLKIHFVIIDKESGEPKAGVKIYGLSVSKGSSLGQTSSGEFVHVPNGNSVENLKKIGVTNKDGEFKAEYILNNYAMIVFEILNEYKLPNQFISSDLQLTERHPTKKIIELLLTGRMKIKNPTPKQKLIIKTKFD